MPPKKKKTIAEIKAMWCDSPNFDLVAHGTTPEEEAELRNFARQQHANWKEKIEQFERLEAETMGLSYEEYQDLVTGKLRDPRQMTIHNHVTETIAKAVEKVKDKLA